MERFLLIGITQDYKSALEYVGDDIVMQEFVEEAMEKSNDEGLLRAYDHVKADIEQGYRDGYYEGNEDAKKKKSLEIAKELIKMNLSIDDIIKATQLERKEIEGLK